MEWIVRPAAGNRRKSVAGATALGAVAIRHDIQILGGDLEFWFDAKKNDEGELRTPRGAPADCRFRNPCPAEADRYPRGIFPEYHARSGAGGTRRRPV